MRFPTSYDHVVVGAGAAGCAIAGRLTEDPDRRVLLLEAGGPDDAERVHATDLGSMTSMWFDPAVTWQHATVPQAGCGGRSIPIPQGRMLGGGSSVNAMMYVRGNRRDFDRWRDLGADGWAYADVLPYFRAAETYAGGDPAYRGTSGALRVIDYPSPAVSSVAFVEGARRLGFDADPAAGPDYNGARQEDAPFYYQSTRSEPGRRCSAADAFLRPALGRPNLTVLTGATVERVLLDGDTAVGVELTRAGARHRIGADAEVVLSAGTLASPRLLMLSGIGPADHLRACGVDPLVDLPGVGRDLQDHLLFGVGWESLVDLPFPQLLAEAGLFTRTVAAPSAGPDLQFFAGPVQFMDDSYKTDGPGFTFAPILVAPRSRGTVTLDPVDPTGPPVVDPHYLDAGEDVDALVEGIALARDVAHTPPFDGLRGRELAPGEEVRDRAGLVDYVRRSASTVWHPAGTCRMGRDPGAVVDPRLRVHGVANLRVADASVMPTVVAGNTNAAAIMIGCRAADLLLDAVPAGAASPVHRPDPRMVPQ
jgi:choline dehydrogenase